MDGHEISTFPMRGQQVGVVDNTPPSQFFPQSSSPRVDAAVLLF